MRESSQPMTFQAQGFLSNSLWLCRGWKLGELARQEPQGNKASCLVASGYQQVLLLILTQHKGLLLFPKPQVCVCVCVCVCVHVSVLNIHTNNIDRNYRDAERQANRMQSI